jgi:hypothetical protein
MTGKVSQNRELNQTYRTQSHRKFTPALKRLRASLRWAKATFIKSETALLFECTLECDQKLFDTADIVRDATSHQSRKWLAKVTVERWVHSG